MPQEISNATPVAVLEPHYTPTDNIYQFLRSLNSLTVGEQCAFEEHIGGYTRDQVRKAIQEFTRNPNVAIASFMNEGESERTARLLATRLKYSILSLALFTVRDQEPNGILDKPTLQGIIDFFKLENNDVDRLMPIPIIGFFDRDYREKASRELDAIGKNINSHILPFRSLLGESLERGERSVVYSKREKQQGVGQLYTFDDKHYQRVASTNEHYYEAAIPNHLRGKEVEHIYKRFCQSLVGVDQEDLGVVLFSEESGQEEEKEEQVDQLLDVDTNNDRVTVLPEGLGRQGSSRQVSSPEVASSTLLLNLSDSDLSRFVSPPKRADVDRPLAVAKVVNSSTKVTSSSMVPSRPSLRK